MIKTLHIENFKSIKKLDLSCKKINIFIGEPNSGKSNIIEALSLFSPASLPLNKRIRLQNLTDLFYDNITDRKINIFLNDNGISISVDKNQFYWKSWNVLNVNQATNNLPGTIIDVSGVNPLSIGIPNEDIRYYSYSSNIQFYDRSPGALTPPFGENLTSIIISNSSFKNLVQEIFKSKGFRLKTKPVEAQIEISKEKNDEIFSYAYSNISETLRRIIFLMACLETNSNSTLLFDEPEANTFPFYTKYFAERIASDSTNQFFFTTHNPYLLESIVAKSSFEDLNVVIAYMEDYETKLRVLSKGEVMELMELDVFFNLKRYTNQA